MLKKLKHLASLPLRKYLAESSYCHCCRCWWCYCNPYYLMSPLWDWLNIYKVSVKLRVTVKRSKQLGLPTLLTKCCLSKFVNILGLVLSAKKSCLRRYYGWIAKSLTSHTLHLLINLNLSTMRCLMFPSFNNLFSYPLIFLAHSM